MKKPWRLLAVLLLSLVLLTACASKATRAQERIELGQKYLTEANYTEAVAAFTEVITIDPSNIEAYMGRAEAYKGLKQYDDAKADYTEVIGKTDEMPYAQAQAYTGRAEVYELTDETTSAESDYSKAIDLLDGDNVGKKENIAETLIRELKIRVLQLHAEVCMKLGQYDKALEDYAKLAELGVNMSDDNAGEQSAEGENTGAGSYVWNYTDENGSTQKMQLMVQPGSNRMNAVVECPSSVLSAQEIAGLIVSAKLGSEYPELQEDYEKLQDMNGLVAEIDPQNVSQEQLAKIKAMEEQWSAFEKKYGPLEEEYAAELNQWAGVDWRPQILESITLSNPISRVEKTADTLYIYVPTGTKYQSCEMTFTSYSGKVETLDATQLVSDGGTQDLSAKPIYEQENRGAAIGTFKIVYKEDQ